jgi:hypothetical protein
MHMKALSIQWVFHNEIIELYSYKVICLMEKTRIQLKTTPTPSSY